MRERSCDACGAPGPEKDGYLLRSRFFCRACVEEASRKVPRSVEPVRARDPTLCSRCEFDNGKEELPRIADVPLCGPCRVAIRKLPFPAWLRISAAVLLLLLVAALIRGVPMIAQGLALIRAERHADAERWSAASDELARVLAAVPDCSRATLLKVKSDLLCDRFDTIPELVERVRSEPFEGALIEQVNGLLERWDRAAGEYVQGLELMEKEQYADAEPHLGKASSTFPESKMLRVVHLRVKAGMRFEARDFDGFLEESEGLVRELPDDPMAVAQLASAAAARYAATGDEAFRSRTTVLLEKARRLCPDEASLEALAEYRERIEHRLRTREVIDKEEYDRRIRTSDEGKQ